MNKYVDKFFGAGGGRILTLNIGIADTLYSGCDAVNPD